MTKTKTMRDIMTKDIVSLPKETSIREAAQKMRDSAIGDVLLQDTDGSLCGIATDRDIVVRAVADGRNLEKTTIGEIASDRLTTLSPDDSFESAVKLMKDHAIRRIPIVDGNKAVGIVSLGDLAVERDRKSAVGHISAAPSS